MAFLKKHVVNEYAEAHGLDLSDMQWAQANLYVQELAKEEGLVCVNGFLKPQEDKPKEHKTTRPKQDDAQLAMQQHIQRLEAEIAKLTARKQSAESNDNTVNDVAVEAGKVYDLPDEEVVISPGLPFMRHQLIKVDEELGDDLDVEEVSLLDQMGNLNEGQTNRTFRVKGKTGRKTVAQSTLPKEQVKITFNYSKDLVPVVHSNDGLKEGYLWSHHSLPNVKELLIASNAYNDYKAQFSVVQHPENVFYCGNLLAVRRDVVHETFKEIERKHGTN